MVTTGGGFTRGGGFEEGGFVGGGFVEGGFLLGAGNKLTKTTRIVHCRGISDDRHHTADDEANSRAAYTDRFGEKECSG